MKNRVKDGRKTMTADEVAHESDSALYTSAARYKINGLFSFAHGDLGTKPFFHYNKALFSLKFLIYQ